jgi:transposase
MEKLFTMSKKELSRYCILEKVVRKEMNQEIAAKALGMSSRQLRRLLKRYREQGPEGLVSGHRKRKEFYSLPKSLKEKVLSLVQERYSGFSLTLTLEKLQENHAVSISLETLRLWILKEGLWGLKRRPKPKLHQSRARRSCLGELIQIDGSFHDWFEGRGEKCSLLGFIDDATSNVMYLQFVPRETTQNYLDLMSTSNCMAYHRVFIVIVILFLESITIKKDIERWELRNSDELLRSSILS